MKNKIVVCKFGGSSLASAKGFRQVADIVRSDSNRRVVVVSAPGKDASHPYKVTDRLDVLSKSPQLNGAVWLEVKNRFLNLARDLGLEIDDLQGKLERIEQRISSNSASRDFILSIGEYFSAILMAKYLGFEFVDASEVIIFGKDRQLNRELSDREILRRCGDGRNCVVPGFYGTCDGEVFIFPRNGSDITGAVIAGALTADTYENWSDSPVLTADPRLVKSAHVIRKITYREIRELAYNGAKILHPSAIGPVRTKGIPLRVKSTANPEDPGTLIVSEREVVGSEVVVGIAGKGGFFRFNLSMDGMHDLTWFAADALQVFKLRGISTEHFPTGTDTMCVLAHKDNLGHKEQEVTRALEALTPNDHVEVRNGIALISIVGLGMVNHVGTLAAIATSVAEAGISVQMITQDFRQTNVIIGVDEGDLAQAINAIHAKFFG